MQIPKEPKAVTKGYSDIVGVDLSNDDSEVSSQRLSDCINVWRYYGAQGSSSIDTIPGFRKLVRCPDVVGETSVVYGMSFFEYRKLSNETVVKPIFHVGKKLYKWDNYPEAASITDGLTEIYSGMAERPSSFFVFNNKLYINDGVHYLEYGAKDVVDVVYKPDIDILLIYAKNEDVIWRFTPELSHFSFYTLWMDDEPLVPKQVVGTVVADEELLLYYDRVQDKGIVITDPELEVRAVKGFVPLTRIGCPPLGGGESHQQRNLLSAGFRNTFVTDGTSTKYYLSEKDLDDTAIEITFDVATGEAPNVVVGEVELVENVSPMWSDYVKSIDRTEGFIEFQSAPPTAETCLFDKGAPTLEIKAYRTVKRDAEKILNCDITAVYDNRVWFSGNPSDPNTVYWSFLNDPSYVGQINFSKDGNSNVPVMGLVQVGEYMAVLKGETQQDATAYLHYPVETGENLNPKTYPSKQSIAKIGCISKNGCINFRDDPVYISRQGLEAIGKMNIGLERSIEHRSTRVDRRLTNETDLEDSVLENWYGYLLVLVNGHIYAADSRYLTENSTTRLPEYEWFYWDEIGVYVGGYTKYIYSYYIPDWLTNVTIDETKAGKIVNPPDSNGTSSITVTEHTETINGTERTWYTYLKDGVTYLCEKCVSNTGDELIGGTFKKAVALREYSGSLYFGTENGYICKFNTDLLKDTATGELDSSAYAFDDRAITSSLTTKFEDFGAYNLTKKFKKRGNIVDLKTMTNSVIKTIIETEVTYPRETKEYPRFSASYFDFGEVDFADFTFGTLKRIALVLKKLKGKKWKRAKVTLYSDEIYRPFGVKSIILVAELLNYAKK